MNKNHIIMKTLLNKSLGTIIGIVAFAAFVLNPLCGHAQSLSAQLTDKDIFVSEFTGIQVSDDFEVTLARGPYGVRLTVDKDLAPYVDIYVKAKTLYLSYDEKAVPKEIKKLYKGKNGLTPVFRVVASTPEIQSISLSDNVTLNAMEEFLTSQFELKATGKSQVKNLSVNATSGKISLKKNAVATMTLRTDRGVEAGTENNSNLKLYYTGNELAINADGSSTIVADGGPSNSMNVFASGSSQVSVTSETVRVNLTVEGSSKVVLNGRAVEMTVKGSRSSTVDAFSMPVETVDANLSNSSNVTVNVSRKIFANLIGGSSLYFSGTPEFQIEKIVKSTLAPYGTK